MDKSILYCIKIGGHNVSPNNIRNVINGIKSNVYFSNYEIHISIEDTVNDEVNNYIKNLIKQNDNHIKHFFFKSLSWYKWLKLSFQNAKNFQYLITSHDDTYFRTKNFDKIFVEEISKINNVGCFSFIDNGYKRSFFNPQLRGAYHIDRVYENSRKLGIEYEYHNQKKNWHRKSVKIKKLLNKLNLTSLEYNDLNFKEDKIFNFINSFVFDFDKIDFPKKTIKAHSLWTNIMGFDTHNLKKFDITDMDVPHGIYADEDICLSTQKNDMINILIPHVSYYHDREIDISRSWKSIKNDQQKVSKLFYNKWKFYPNKLENMNLTEKLDLIEYLEKKFNKKLTWTKNFYSYNWQYID